MVSAGLWLPSLLLAEAGENTVTCRRLGAAYADTKPHIAAGEFKTRWNL